VTGTLGELGSAHPTAKLGGGARHDAKALRSGRRRQVELLALHPRADSCVRALNARGGQPAHRTVVLCRAAMSASFSSPSIAILRARASAGSEAGRALLPALRNRRVRTRRAHGEPHCEP
jgi:hypothetical protein